MSAVKRDFRGPFSCWTLEDLSLVAQKMNQLFTETLQTMDYC